MIKTKTQFAVSAELCEQNPNCIRFVFIEGITMLSSKSGQMPVLTTTVLTVFLEFVVRQVAFGSLFDIVLISF